MAKSMSKADFIAAMAEKTGMSKREVGTFMDSMNGLVMDQLKMNGQVTIPGMIKFRMSERAATPERMGRNPFTGQPQMIKAKPARHVVKASPVKAMKDMVGM